MPDRDCYGGSRQASCPQKDGLPPVITRSLLFGRFRFCQKDHFIETPGTDQTESRELIPRAIRSRPLREPEADRSKASLILLLIFPCRISSS